MEQGLGIREEVSLGSDKVSMQLLGPVSGEWPLELPGAHFQKGPYALFSLCLGHFEISNSVLFEFACHIWHSKGQWSTCMNREDLPGSRVHTFQFKPTDVVGSRQFTWLNLTQTGEWQEGLRGLRPGPDSGGAPVVVATTLAPEESRDVAWRQLQYLSQLHST